MNVKTALNNELLAQDFAGEVNLNRYLTHYKQVASMYAEVENSIAVLSDMGSNRSYIYYGKVGEFLGIALHGECHPDDLVKKHTRELRFLHFLKNALEKQRNDYYLEEYLRMCDSVGKYHQVLHRMFYVIAQDTGNICLALCLYNLTEVSSIGSMIVNSADGSRIDMIRTTVPTCFQDVKKKF